MLPLALANLAVTAVLLWWWTGGTP
jgi:hypothetical protein